MGRVWKMSGSLEGGRAPALLPSHQPPEHVLPTRAVGDNHAVKSQLPSQQVGQQRLAHAAGHAVHCTRGQQEEG